MPVKKKARRDIHYEVQAREGANWTILDLVHVEDEALDICERQWKAGRYKAVRIIREKFNQTTNTFDSLELTYKGRKFGPKEDVDATAVICLTPADLYLADSRRNLGRLLNDILSKWQVTPIELLHCPKHYLRLEGTGSFLQGAVQRAAIAQNKESGNTVQERMKQIYSIIERAAKNLKDEWDEGRVPELDLDGNLAAVFPKLEKEGERRVFLMTAVLARDLQAVEGFAAKVSRVLELLKPEYPEWVFRAADGILAECLTQGDAAPELVAGADMGASLVNVARLARGVADISADAEVSPEDGTEDGAEDSAEADTEDSGESTELAFLRQCLADNLLPQVRRGLLRVIGRKLGGSDKLCGGALQEEMEALSAVRISLDGAEDELLGDTTIMDAIEDRCTRFLNPEFIAAYLADKDGPEETLTALVELEDHCYGQQNKRRIANYILPLLQSDENEMHFTRAGENPMDRMRYLAGIQASILASGINESHKDKMVDRTDQLCFAIMEKAKLLNRISAGGSSSLESGKRLLAMMAAECFTEGRAKNAAMNELRIFLTQPEFTTILQAGPDDATGAEVRTLIQTLAAKAGIDLGLGA